MQSSIFDFASPNGGTTGCRDLSCNKGCGGAIRCSYCGNQHIEKNEKCRECNIGNGCVNLPPSPTRNAAAASSTSAAAAISSSAATSSTQVVNPYSKSSTTGDKGRKRSSSLTSRDGGNSDEDGSVFTDNEGNETDSDDGDNEEESDDEDALDEDDEEVYTLFTGQNGGTYATLSGGELPDSITQQNYSQPMPQRSMLTNDELLIQLLGGMDDEEEEKERSEPPINPSDTPEFRKELRRLNDNVATYMPKATMCSYGCGCIAECLLDPEDKTPGPRRGQYTNSLCYQHGRALIADLGGTLIECPSECKCGRNRAKGSSPLCRECYLDMECIKKGCKQKRWSWDKCLCLHHELLKPCTGSSGNCNRTRDRPGRNLCKACNKSSPSAKCTSCGEPVWRLERALCERCELAKPCKKKSCDELVWGLGSAFCAGCEGKKQCKSCGKPRGRSGKALCAGCEMKKLCKKEECKEKVAWLGSAYCKAHLGGGMCKKCEAKWPVKNMNGFCADCAPLCRKDGCLRLRKEGSGRKLRFCGGQAKCNTFPN